MEEEGLMKSCHQEQAPFLIITTPPSLLSSVQDNFGYGETALGAVFALNGIAVGLLQVFLIKNLFARLGT